MKPSVVNVTKGVTLIDYSSVDHNTRTVTDIIHCKYNTTTQQRDTSTYFNLCNKTSISSSIFQQNIVEFRDT